MRVVPINDSVHVYIYISYENKQIDRQMERQKTRNHFLNLATFSKQYHALLYIIFSMSLSSLLICENLMNLLITHVEMTATFHSVTPRASQCYQCKCFKLLPHLKIFLVYFAVCSLTSTITVFACIFPCISYIYQYIFFVYFYMY